MNSSRLRVAVYILVFALGCLIFITPVRADTPPTHTVTEGETVDTIAWSLGIFPEALAKANGITILSPLRVGSVLKIPLQTPTKPLTMSGYYIAPTDETVKAIALRFGVSADVIAAANDLRPDGVVYAGWSLKVPQGLNAVATTDALAHAYVVQPGESLADIASRNGTTLEDLASANNLVTGATVAAGQRLTIPTGKDPSAINDMTAASMSIYVPNVPLYRQQQSLTCEEASVAMATRGIVTEAKLLAVMPVHDNPFKGIRGRTNGPYFGGITDYGSYAQAIQIGLNRLGVKSTVYYGQSYDDFKTAVLDNLRAGRPLVWWHTWHEIYQTPVLVTTSDGAKVKLVPYEHATTLVGANDTGVIYNDTNGTVRSVSWADFRRSSGYFDNMALAIDAGNPPSAPANPTPIDGANLGHLSDTSLSWSTTGSTCDVHIWGGSTNITANGGSCSSYRWSVVAGGSYQWQVTAHNSYGDTSGPIWHVAIRPPGPTALSAKQVSQTQINLSWAKSSDDPGKIDNYKVYDGTGPAIQTLSAGTTTYPVSNLVCGKAYAFYVTAVRQGVESDASNLVNARTQACPPGANLSNLVLSSGTLVPAFSMTTTGYTVSVPNNVTSLTVTPTAVDPKASIKVNGTVVYSGRASTAINLDVGLNTITVGVSASDGSVSQNHTVVVTRAALMSGFASPPWTSWRATSGVWSISGAAPNQSYSTPGVAGRFASAVYPATYGDLDFQVQLLRQGCASCAHGIDIRGLPGSPDGGWMNAYQFEINRNGYYSVWRGVNDNWIGLQHWTYTSAIRRGDSSNTLRVLMIGSRMNLFINGTLVWVGNDTKLGSGQVGAFIAREGSRTTNDSLQVSSAKLTIPGASLLSELPAISTAQESLNAQGNSAKQGTLSEGTK